MGESVDASVGESVDESVDESVNESVEESVDEVLMRLLRLLLLFNLLYNFGPPLKKYYKSRLILDAFCANIRGHYFFDKFSPSSKSTIKVDIC